MVGENPLALFLRYHQQIYSGEYWVHYTPAFIGGIAYIKNEYRLIITANVIDGK